MDSEPLLSVKDNGDSPLHVAVRLGNIKLVWETVSEPNIDSIINQLNYKHETPLHLACALGHLNIIWLLVAFGADVFIMDRDGVCAYDFSIVQLITFSRLGQSNLTAIGDSSLHDAVNSGNIESVQRIIKQQTVLVNYTNSNHETPLHLACTHGYSDIVHVLLSNGADMYTRDCYNNTPIHRAIIRGRENIVDHLITKFSCDAAVKGFQGRTLVHLACCLGHTTLVSSLIQKYQIAHTASDASSLTPLHLAIMYNNIPVARELISKYDHPVDCMNKNKETPLHYACFSGQLHLVKMLVQDYHANLHICDEYMNRPLNKAVLGGHKDVVRALISSFRCSPYIKGFQGRSLLHQACIKGDIELSIMLIADYNLDFSVDNSGNTPLHLACMGGHEKLARLLINKYGCPINAKNKNSETPLHISCSFGNIGIIRMLILEYKADIHACDNQNDTPINTAALNGQKETVKLLKDTFGCNLKVEGNSLLHRACYKGNIEPVVMLMTDFDLDPFSADNNGNTSLHLACLGGHVELARLLITKYGCSIKVKNNKHETPLHGACLSGNTGIVSMLVFEFNADINAHDHKNYTPVCNAIINGYTDILQMFISAFRQSLQIQGFEFNRSLLHHACQYGSIESSVKLITEFHLQPNSGDDNGDTPLHMACWGGHEELATLLITEYNCHVRVRNNNQETPLHTACSRGHLDVVKMLVSRNADVNASNYEEHTPISLAVLGGHTGIVKFLISIPKCRAEAKGYKGRTVLHLACYSGNIELSNILLSNFHLLAWSYDDRDNSPLHMACWGGHENVARLLIRYGYTVDDKNLDGWTPLHFACVSGHTNVIRVLILEYEAMIDVHNNEGDTPLHKAAEGGHTDLLQTLIKDFKIDPNVIGFQGRTLLHTACSRDHHSTARLLVDSFQFLLLKTDNYGNTPLHVSAMLGQTKCVYMLLFEYRAPVFLRNKGGNSTLEVSKDSISYIIREYLKSERDELQSQYKQLQEISTQKYSGSQKLTRIFVVGNVESGKSTLVESLKRDSFFSSFSKVSEAIVPPHTCGIVPSVHCSKAWGRVLYYDFAGDSEYYSSHSAILSNVVHSHWGTNLFLVVVNLTKEYNCICEEIGYWFSFIANHTDSKLNTCKILIVGSHADIVTRSVANMKLSQLSKDYTTHPSIEVVNTVALDCRRPRSSQPLRKSISQILRFSPSYFLSLDCAILLGLLEKDFKNVVTCKLGKVLSHIAETGICLPQAAKSLYPLLTELHALGLLMVVERNDQDEYTSDNTTLLLNVPKLTNEVHQLLFSGPPAYATIPQISTTPYSASMGILPKNYLNEILPDYISIECLVQLQYCQEFSHAVVNTDYSVVLTEESSNSTLFYFPALCRIERKKNIVTPLSYKYSMGWFAECCGKFDYFPPRFLHVLLLQLAFKFAQPVAPCEISGRSEAEIEMLKSNCRCTMWKSGIHWHMEEGVECIVELVNNNRGLVVITKSDEVYNNKCKCTDMLFKIVGMAMQAKAKHCSPISLNLYLMLLNCDDISSFNERGKLFDMKDVDRVLNEGKDSVLSITGKWPVKTAEFAHLRRFTFWDQIFPLEINVILSYIKTIVREWHSLGIALRLSSYVLEEISVNNQQNVRACKEKMISVWINDIKTAPASWWVLVKALQSINQNGIVSKIRSKFDDELSIQEKLLEPQYSHIKPGDIFLKSFARVICSHWPSFASLLSLTADDIEEIKKQSSQELQALDMLKKWKLNADSEATYGELCKQLKTVTLFPS